MPARRVVSSLPNEDCPYVGLRAYTEKDSEYFSGRAPELQTITANLYAARLTILYGTSGVGKSSLLQAGVLPFLKKRRRNIVVYHGDWQAEDAIARLYAECGRQIESAPEPPPKQKKYALEDEDPETEPEPALRSADGHAPLDVLCDTGRGTVYLILDQFEDYLLGGPFGVEREFDAELARTINRQDLTVHLLLGIRQEDLSKLDRLRARIPNLFSNMLHLKSLSKEGAEAALREPLAAYNARFPQRAVSMGAGAEDPVAAVSTGAQRDGEIEASLLQVVMNRLWEEETRIWWRNGAIGPRQLRASTLNQALGGVSQIVVGHLDEVMAELAPKERGIGAAIFRELVSSKGDRVSRFVDNLSFLIKQRPKAVQHVLAILEEKRVLRHIPPGQCEIRPALTEAVLRWRKQYTARRMRIQMTLWSAAVAVLLAVAGAVGYQARGYWRHQMALQRVFLADESLAKDPEASITLSRYALQERDEPTTREVLRKTVESVYTRDWKSSVFAIDQSSSPSIQTVSFGGNRMAAASEEGLVRVWDYKVAGGVPTVTAQRDFPVPDKISAAALSKSGNWLAAACDDHRARLWDLRSSQPRSTVRELRGHEGEVWSVAFSPDEQLLASAGEDGTARLWDTASGKCLQVVKPADSNAAVVAVAFSATGALLITAGMDNMARIWSVATGKLLNKLEGHSYYVYGAAFSPRPNLEADSKADSKWVATASWDGTARVWDVKSGRTESIFRINRADKLGGVDFSSDGSWLAAASRSGQVSIWDWHTGREVLDLACGAAQFFGISFSPDHRFLAAATNDGYVKVWDLPFSRLADLRGQITSVAFDERGTLVAAGSSEGVVLIRDLKSSSVFPAMERHTGSVTAVAFGPVWKQPDKLRLASGDKAGVVRVWNPEGAHVDSKQVIPVTSKGKTTVEALAFDASGRRLAVGGWDAILRIWDFQDNSIRDFQPHGARMRAVAFSPDGRWVAAGGESTVRREPRGAIWDLSNPGASPVDGFECSDDIYALDFHPKRREIAMGCADGNARIYRFDTKQYVNLHGAFPHRADIYAIQFDSDGDRVATASADGTAKVWDAGTGAFLATAYGHQGGVVGISFRPSHDYLTTVGIDKTVRVHALNFEEVKAGAARRGRPLAPSDCRGFFSNPVCPALE